MATLGRSDEIRLFLDSLLVQTFKDFELIIVDQNADDRVKKIYDEYKDKITITYIRNEQKGLSVNRNVGLTHVFGDVVAFPDDDCEYLPDTLEKVAAFFEHNPVYNFYTCNTKDKTGIGNIFNAKKTNADISIYNFMSVGISFTIFARREALINQASIVEYKFRFDERMGVGTEFGSGEESDMLLFLLKNKNNGRYHAADFIYHPAKPEIAEKAFIYGKGFGAVYKKAITRYCFFALFPVFVLRVIKGIINIIVYSNKKMRLDSLRGRVLGFIQYK
jgi:glycosyltransferase involved in cell wall biosynthesis